MRRTEESGREREAKEIAKYQRAAEVGRLMLNDLRDPMKWIFYKQYLDRPRRELREQREAIRTYLRSEVEKFCNANFENVKPVDLARLYEPLYARGSTWRLPLIEFVELLGRPREGVLRGLHYILQFVCHIYGDCKPNIQKCIWLETWHIPSTAL